LERAIGIALALALGFAGVPPPADAEGDAAPASTDDVLARGAELQRRARFSDAVIQYRGAVSGFEREGRTGDRRTALLRLAEAQQALGQYGESVQSLTQALGDEEKAADPGAAAAILASRASAWLALGNPARAREDLEKGLALASKAGDPALAASVQVNFGNLEAAQQHADEALGAYEDAATLARAPGASDVRARALANAAALSLRTGQAPEVVRRRLAEAAPLARGLPDSHDKAYLLINLGRTYMRLAEAKGADQRSDLKEAHVLLREAERVSDEIGDPLAASYATGFLGEIYESRGRREEALELTRRARFRAQEAAAPESLYRWQWQTGRLLRAQGDGEGAIAAYRDAVETLHGIRHEMARGSATGQDAFRETVGPVFFELVDLLLQSSPSETDLAAYQARLLDVRETVEQLKAAELRDYFRDECVDAVQAKVEKLDQVSTSAVVIYPILLPDRLELLLTLPKRMKRVTVPVPAERLTAEVRQLRALLEKRTTREYLPHAQQLYDWLVRPFEDELAAQSVDTLVFVPDGPLRTIPMGALHDGSRFVAERWAVATTPGLSLTDPHPLDREHLSLLASGLSEGVQGFAPLSYVEGELRAVRELYGGTLLMNEDFRLARIEDTLRENEFNVVHIASHGEFAEDVAQSFVLTYDGRLTMDRLGEYVGLFRFRDTPIELLTLSACETAQGDDRAALGLAGVAIKAGARSALGTLWSVNDAASAELVAEFYRQLRDELVTKAVALQRAQQKLRANPSYDHPFYWSPFLLISNWL
jgi:CHAT domain-containing protein